MTGAPAARRPSNGPDTVRPFTQVVVKIHSRCNLACDYCYVYRHADQSWRRRPTVMSRATVDALARRLGEHARDHRLARIAVVLHGGEPMLAGVDRIRHLVRTVRGALPDHTAVSFTIQTNGVLLDEAVLSALAEDAVRVGVSMDGGPEAHDRHRRFADGRGSYPAVVRALRLLQGPFRPLYAGILCTVDVRNDPVSTYEHLLGFAPPRLDLLLPHGNHSAPPPMRPANRRRSPYAAWLVSVFDRWYDAPRQETRIRLFESIIDLWLGRPSLSEAVGLDPVDVVTVETDGALEQSDALKTTAHGLAATGMRLTDRALDDVARHPGVRARQTGLAALSATCRACPVVRVCGGGLYAHRYRAGAGFANPSVYCPDLYYVVRHVQWRLRDDLLALLGPLRPLGPNAA